MNTINPLCLQAIIITSVLACLPMQSIAQTDAGIQNQTFADELFVEPPTLENLGFEWFIRGDDNRNATVSVSYRQQGSTEWHDALPMLRIGRTHLCTGKFRCRVTAHVRR